MSLLAFRAVFSSQLLFGAYAISERQNPSFNVVIGEEAAATESKSKDYVDITVTKTPRITNKALSQGAKLPIPEATQILTCRRQFRGLFRSSCIDYDSARP